jgi:hypothetical protein
MYWKHTATEWSAFRLQSKVYRINAARVLGPSQLGAAGSAGLPASARDCLHPFCCWQYPMVSVTLMTPAIDFLMATSQDGWI